MGSSISEELTLTIPQTCRIMYLLDNCSNIQDLSQGLYNVFYEIQLKKNLFKVDDRLKDLNKFCLIIPDHPNFKQIYDIMEKNYLDDLIRDQYIKRLMNPYGFEE